MAHDHRDILDERVEHARRALAANEGGHKALLHALAARFGHYHSVDDITEIIELLSAEPPHDRSHAYQLASACWDRFLLLAGRADIDRTVEIFERLSGGPFSAVVAPSVLSGFSRSAEEGRAEACARLAVALLDRFRRFPSRGDIDRAIDLARTALAISSWYDLLLADALEARGYLRGSHSDLTEAGTLRHRHQEPPGDNFVRSERAPRFSSTGSEWGDTLRPWGIRPVPSEGGTADRAMEVPLGRHDAVRWVSAEGQVRGDDGLTYPWSAETTTEMDNDTDWTIELEDHRRSGKNSYYETVGQYRSWVSLGEVEVGNGDRRYRIEVRDLGQSTFWVVYRPWFDQEFLDSLAAAPDQVRHLLFHWGYRSSGNELSGAPIVD